MVNVYPCEFSIVVELIALKNQLENYYIGCTWGPKICQLEWNGRVFTKEGRNKKKKPYRLSTDMLTIEVSINFIYG